MTDKKLAITTLNNEIDWLQSVIDQVIRSYLLQEGHEQNWLDIPLPDLAGNTSPYGRIVQEWSPDVYSRLAIALTTAPHIRPEALDVFFGKNQLYDRAFTEFGGVIDQGYTGFLPTAQTLYFLVCATDPSLRYQVMELLAEDSILIKEKVLLLSETAAHLPGHSGILSLNKSWFYYFLTGNKP